MSLGMTPKRWHSLPASADRQIGRGRRGVKTSNSQFVELAAIKASLERREPASITPI
jgi:hypothetical protein